jgi:hypothetical protein
MRCFIAKGIELMASSNIPDITDDNIDAVIDHHVALLANEDGSEQNYLQIHVDLLTRVKEEVLARWVHLKEITERHKARIRERWMENDHRRKAPAAFERVASHITMASIQIFYGTLDGH